MAFKRRPPPDNVRRVLCLGRNIRGITTNKCGHLVQFESELEHTLILLLERDVSVADYRSQPEVLDFRDSTGRTHTYTPDFQVWRTDGRIELHEVTVETRRRQRARLGQREAAAETICRERGWSYVVHTDQSLPAGYEYANLSFLAAFRSAASVSDGACAWWVVNLAGRGPIPLRVILAQIPCAVSSGRLLNGLYHLLWKDVIRMDWQRPLIVAGALHPTAQVWLASEEVAR